MEMIVFYKDRKIQIYENGNWVDKMSLSVFKYNHYYKIIESKYIEFDVGIHKIQIGSEVVEIINEWDYHDFNNKTQIIDGLITEFQEFPDYEIVGIEERRRQVIDQIIQ